jgi:hypothetical protein
MCALVLVVLWSGLAHGQTPARNCFGLKGRPLAQPCIAGGSQTLQLPPSGIYTAMPSINSITRAIHYRCSKAKDGTTITLVPIEGGDDITLSCTNCECGPAK